MLTVRPALLTTPTNKKPGSATKKRGRARTACPKVIPKHEPSQEQSTSNTHIDEEITDRLGAMSVNSRCISTLSGHKLGQTAFSVTRRLSMSAYMNRNEEVNSTIAPSEHSEPIYSDNDPKEPTYKMQPDLDQTFSQSQTKVIADRILRTMLAARRYDAVDCPKLTTKISSMINTRLKDLDMPRYKTVCNVVIGQKQDQGFEVASRCLWNANTDNFTFCSYSNEHLFAVAMIHAVYLD